MTMHKLRNTLITIMAVLLTGSLLVFLWKGPVFWRTVQELGDTSPVCQVPLLIDPHDENSNGQPDALDIVEGARGEVERETVYTTEYHAGGYPPEGQGACTDVVWRGFRQAGYNLKGMVDADIQEHSEWYGDAGQDPDPNIDFRRCQNLIVFFTHHGQALTIEYTAWDPENLQEWQPGDLVFFDVPHEHVGVVSDQRMLDGIPYIIHNPSPHAIEGDALNSWPSPIIGHYRYTPDQ